MLTEKKWVVIFLVLIVFLISCGFIAYINKNRTNSQVVSSVQNEDKQLNTVEQTETMYKRLTANATKEGNNIVVTGETDLPNGSKLTIEIERPILWKGETEKRYMHLEWSNPIIKDGKYSASIKIDSIIYDWDDNYKPDLQCVVTVSFHPNWYGEKSQNDEVIKSVGEHGEKLDGQLVKIIGELTDKPYKTLENTTSVEFPFTKPNR